ncbi:MAG: glycine zipper 2TM domain-containing protein, partial [Acetobacteraceae bacterium]
MRARPMRARVAASPAGRPASPPARALALLTPLLLTPLLLGGCTAGGYGLPGGDYFAAPVSADPCAPQRQALAAADDYFTRDILTGALVGATGGGVIGSLVSGDWRGALTGAAVGGAAGAIAGYWQALARQNADQAAMDARFSGDIGRENGWISRAQGDFDALMACRLNQAQQIRAAYAAGTIDRPTAEARLAAVRQAAAADLALARRIDARVNQRSAAFVYAADHLSPGTEAAVLAYHRHWYGARTRRPVAILLRPQPDAPAVGRLPAGSTVTAAASEAGFALVKTGGETRGFVPAAALASPAPAPPPPAPPAADPVQRLAGSNAARRDSFARRVA